MTEARFNLMFKGEVESGKDLDEARNILESLFEFETENPGDLFNGQAIILGRNMDATTANSFKQVLASTGIITRILASEDRIAVKEYQSRRLEQRRNNFNRRIRIRSGAILPDRRLVLDRRV